MGLDDQVEPSENKCRVIVLGASRPRLQKVASLLLEESSSGSTDGGEYHADPFREGRDGTRNEAVTIEYLPCIPDFGSYADPSGGPRVRYLARVDYLGRDGARRPAGTLLPFVDESTTSMNLHEEADVGDVELPKDGVRGSGRAKARVRSPRKSPRNQNMPLFGPISGMAVVDALSEEGSTDPDSNGEDRLREDVDRVSAFLTSILPHRYGVAVDVMPPGSAFRNIHEELSAFKALTADEKKDASARGEMGPGKMARFVRSFAERLVHDALEERRKQQEQQKMEQEAAQATISTQEEAEDVQQSPNSAGAEAETPIDPTRDRYACRTCRFALFGQDDLQIPPHAPSRHHFSHKKQRGSTSGARHECQSIFLRSGRPWMGTMSDHEGKLSCPKCDAKVGSWNWSGAQCSCGTWIVPAIQFPSSRVDLVPPASSPQQHQLHEHGHLLVSGLPPGTVVSPVVLQALRVQKGETSGHYEPMPS